MASPTKKKHPAAALAAYAAVIAGGGKYHFESIDKHHEKEDDKDAIIANLQLAVEKLISGNVHYYCSTDTTIPQMLFTGIPDHGMSARHVKERILQQNELDFKPRLNTSSYVNVVTEPEEDEIALLSLKTNLADGSVYPASTRLHDTVVNMLAKLWNCPPGKDGGYSGSGTVGSTEGCLLAGLALKFRWRKWYAAKHGKTADETRQVLPNLVISSAFQACWEKFFRYFDVEPRFVKPALLGTAAKHHKDRLAVDASKFAHLCDDKTIGVVGILGNHYNGSYDPIWEIDEVIEKVNKEKGYQIGIHVDAASGGFIAPFQEGMPPFDFRLKNVLSISASGHKFGESVCGTGWVVFRQREDLSEHIAVSVSYLGGSCDSITLNFSRPALAAYSQYYKLLRLGRGGYERKVANQMHIAKFIREHIKGMKHKDGKTPRFQMLDAGDKHCLPVVAARLNPDLNLKYDDIDLQHAMSESHWYVSGYELSFDNHAKNGKSEALSHDVGQDHTMFRIVVKSNLTLDLAENLTEQFSHVLPMLDSMEAGYSSIHSATKAVEDSSGHNPC